MRNMRFTRKVFGDKEIKAVDPYMEGEIRIDNTDIYDSILK